MQAAIFKANIDIRFALGSVAGAAGATAVYPIDLVHHHLTCGAVLIDDVEVNDSTHRSSTQICIYNDLNNDMAAGEDKNAKSEN